MGSQVKLNMRGPHRLYLSIRCVHVCMCYVWFCGFLFESMSVCVWVNECDCTLSLGMSNPLV